MHQLLKYGLSFFIQAKDAVTAFGYRVLREVLRVLSAPFVAFYFVLLALFTPMSASAAIDVSSALTTFGDVNTAIPIIGAAFLAALGVLAAWKLIRGAFA